MSSSQRLREQRKSMQISSQFSAQSNFVKISDKQKARHMSNLNTRTFHNVLKIPKMYRLFGSIFKGETYRLFLKNWHCYCGLVCLDFYCCWFCWMKTIGLKMKVRQWTHNPPPQCYLCWWSSSLKIEVNCHQQESHKDYNCVYLKGHIIKTINHQIFTYLLQSTLKNFLSKMFQ